MEKMGFVDSKDCGREALFIFSARVVSEDRRNQTRAFRESLRSRGKDVPRIQKSALRDELVILPGAAMSAADVVRALRKYIREVEENGMWIGWYKDQLLVERVDGTLEEAA